MGAVAAFIVLDAATVASEDVQVLRAAYIGMDLVTDWAIVPLALAAFASGLVMSLGTKWGLFRHWWVLATLALTAAATLVLLVQVPLIGHRASMAADPATSDADLRAMGNLLLHSVGGTVVLLVITVLNIVKPRGLTKHGWKRQQADKQSGLG
ncbi:MAG: hypothetical protein ABR586_01410 [Thermoplasmatota archaeon]